MSTYSDMTTTELREACKAMQAEVERREAEEAARGAVDDAVQAYATGQGLTMLQAWRALAPEGVEVPEDPEPEPIPDAPEWEQPHAGSEYMTGDLVSFEGHVYRSRIDNNGWSPKAYPQGWELIA